MLDYRFPRPVPASQFEFRCGFKTIDPFGLVRGARRTMFRRLFPQSSSNAPLLSLRRTDFSNSTTPSPTGKDRRARASGKQIVFLSSDTDYLWHESRVQEVRRTDGSLPIQDFADRQSKGASCSDRPFRLTLRPDVQLKRLGPRGSSPSGLGVVGDSPDEVGGALRLGGGNDYRLWICFQNREPPLNVAARILGQ